MQMRLYLGKLEPSLAKLCKVCSQKSDLINHPDKTWFHKGSVDIHGCIQNSECFFLYKCILYFSPFNTDAQRNLSRKLIDWILRWSFLTFKTTQHLKRLLSLNFCVNYEWNLIKYQSTTWVLMDKLIFSPFSLWANAIMTSQLNHHLHMTRVKIFLFAQLWFMDRTTDFCIS